MKKCKKPLLIAIPVIAVIIGYLIGYKYAYHKFENSYQKMIDRTYTFPATISEVYSRTQSRSLHVDGLETNNQNYRGKFDLHISDKTDFKCMGNNISFSDLEAGDYILVTYAGTVAESYPGQIHDVLRIELLEDNL